ncbi:MAG TPA: lysophospholipid acyltransferase family protein [Candidatus Limnocylindria bacterium]|nr:lysophospholipid acyltransferase family protein [Candidatus Limnocylindria bacterium]
MPAGDGLADGLVDAMDDLGGIETSQTTRTPASSPVPAPRRARVVDRAVATRLLPRGELSPFQRWFRHWFSRTLSAILMRLWFRVTVEGREHFQDRPCLYAFNHLGWMDPLAMLATFPSKPRLYFYGPKEENMLIGTKNRFMWWTGIPVPFSPHKDDLRESVRRAQAVFDSGGSLAIAPEGRIHVHEGDLLPLEEGAAYLALRAQVPIVPVAISGTSSGRFRGPLRVRIGPPIETSGVRPTRGAIAHFSARSWHAIRAMVDGDGPLLPPGRLGRWLTDSFNDWGEGGREGAASVRGPDPADVPIPPLD